MHFENNKCLALQSKTIDILRFPLAVLVVAIHTYFNEGLKARGNIDIPFSGEWAHEFIRFFSITLSDCAVPMFFVISGYLYFLKNPHLTRECYLKKTKKKCVSLLLPFFCWSAVACMIEPSRFLAVGTLEKITGFWSLTMGLWQGAGPWDGPLWFMRDLFVVMLCAPLIELTVRKMRLGGGGILLYVPLLAGYNMIVPGISIRAFLFFMLGAFLAIKSTGFLASLKLKFVLPAGLIFLVLRNLSYGCLADYHSVILESWILVSMATYYALARQIADSTDDISVWKKLSAASFVIYAMHRLFNSKVSALGLMLIGKPSLSGVEAVALYLLTIAITVAVCYIADKWISKSKILSLLLKGTR